MSQQLISRSADLKRLQDDGYNLEVKDGYLLMQEIPYVNEQQQVKRGVLVSKLDLAGDVTTTPSTHLIYFSGDYPCDRDGKPLAKIRHQSNAQALSSQITVNHSFSSKPKGGYKDFWEKLTTYAAILSSPAQSLDSKVSAKTFPAIEASEPDSVFNYQDTASSRANICMLMEKFAQRRVAIVGLGGTGSYVLDLVAKTPVREIHLFDKDTFSQHNAFRTPGAPSIEQLRERPSKVAYLKKIYSAMRRGIFAHEIYLDSSNIDKIQEMDFVFLCIDLADAKPAILDGLEKFKVPFVDLGMGVEIVDNSLLGILRVTAGNEDNLNLIKRENRIPMQKGAVDRAYSQNIQIADLNCLNAALAVVKWKKSLTFYLDLEREYHSTYTLDGNTLINEACY